MSNDNSLVAPAIPLTFRHGVHNAVLAVSTYTVRRKSNGRFVDAHENTACVALGPNITTLTRSTGPVRTNIHSLE